MRTQDPLPSPQGQGAGAHTCSFCNTRVLEHPSSSHAHLSNSKRSRVSNSSLRYRMAGNSTSRASTKKSFWADTNAGRVSARLFGLDSEACSSAPAEASFLKRRGISHVWLTNMVRLPEYRAGRLPEWTHWQDRKSLQSVRAQNIRQADQCSRIGPSVITFVDSFLKEGGSVSFADSSSVLAEAKQWQHRHCKSQDHSHMNLQPSAHGI